MTGKKWDWGMARIAFLDAETSGVTRPWKPLPLLLEVGLVLTDGDLNELGRYQAVIRHDPAVLAAADMPQIVANMHAASGLWDDLRGSNTVPIVEAERAMIDLVDRFDLGEDHPIVWAGFSPSAVDRPVVGRYMPDYYRRIHYRTLDVSALKLALRNWSGVDLEKAHLDQDLRHRALNDALESVQAARTARRFFSLTGAGHVGSVTRTAEVSVR